MSRTNPRRLCIIPAKGLSTRLKRKNILPLGGHPLIAHAIRKAIQLGMFDRVVVSTEDGEIADIARQYGAEVPYMRPRELSVDPATISDVCIHMLNWLEVERGDKFDQLVLMLATSPLVLMPDIRAAIEDFEAHGGEASLLGICQTDQPPFTTQLMDENGELHPAFPESPFRDMKSNECPPAYHSNGCVAVVDPAWLVQTKSLYGEGTRGFAMPRARSLDIDTTEEYEMVAALYSLETTPRDEGLF